ncbi:MAG: FkbM family methyltransferase [Hyphomicrobium sp.]|nr:FkbM family methyltransferase [Hyphomicrobium sp.]
MDRWIRRSLERAFWDRIAVANATCPHAAAALIESIKPKTAIPLKRFGPRGDGGYLMPDDLEGIAACISPGVSCECGFDEEIADLGIDVLMADASVTGPPKQHPRFHFFRKFVDITATPNAMTMADLAAKTPAGDLLLQMDIEGAEYRVLAGMSDDLLQRFRIMVIEFHDLDQMFQRFAFDIMKPVFEKLTRHHHVVHAHPNNCAAPVNRSSLSVPPVMEFTFYRKDRVQGPLEQPMSYPHALDASCVQDRPPVALPACWR